MAEQKNKYPVAYLPFSTLITGLDHLKQISIPNEIEAGTFPSMSSQSKSQLLSALRFFELIDGDGKPKPELTALAYKDDQRKALMKGLIEKHYPDIVALDFAKITPTQLDNALSGERYNVSGETKKKAKTFLLKAAQFAGFTVHPLLIKITRNRKGGKRTSSPQIRATPIDYDKLDKKGQNTNGTQKTIELNNGGTITISLDVNILELKGEDRKFVFDLIDQLDVYQTALPNE